MRAVPLLVAALTLAGALPTEAGPDHGLVAQGILAALGGLPETARVNGVEVAAHDALALVDRLGGPGPGPSARQLVVPDKDIGLAQRIGPDECLFAVVVLAQAYGADPLVNETFTGAPSPFDLDNSLRCGGFGVPMFPYLLGATGAAVSASANYWHVCLNQGLWLDWPALCHVADFRVVTLVGRVGYVDVDIQGVHLQYLLCGVAKHSPDQAGERDLCTVALQR